MFKSRGKPLDFFYYKITFKNKKINPKRINRRINMYVHQTNKKIKPSKNLTPLSKTSSSYQVPPV